MEKTHKIYPPTHTCEETLYILGLAKFYLPVHGKYISIHAVAYFMN